MWICLPSFISFLIHKVLFIKHLVHTHHGKMVLLKERIDTWLKQLVSFFPIIFSFVPGVMRLWQHVNQLHAFLCSSQPRSLLSLLFLIGSIPCSSPCLWLHVLSMTSLYVNISFLSNFFKRKDHLTQRVILSSSSSFIFLKSTN